MKSLLFVTVFSLVIGCQSTGIKSSLHKKKLLNGVELLNFKDENYPNFYVIVWSNRGAFDEDSKKSGVTSILGDYLKEGSQKKTKKEILAALSKIGAKINTVTNQEQFYVSASSLVEDSFALSQLVTEVVLQPGFEKTALEDIKSKQKGYIKQIDDSPGSLVDKLFTKQMFDNHPYSRLTLGSLKTVNSIKLKDIKEHYQTVLSPSSIKVALIGNWTPETERHIIAEFSDLDVKSLSTSSSKVTVNEKSRERIFYSKKDLEQAQVKMGVTTVSLGNPDFLPLSLGLKVLGGSFKSLLNNELRVKRGLTYGVNAGVRVHSQGGLVIISSAVRYDKLVQFVDVAEKVIDDFIKRGISVEELNKMKALYAGEYPRSLETLEQEASMYLNYEALGFSGNEIYKFLNQIQKITKDQVDGALRRQLDLNHLNLTVLGDVRKVKDLKKLNARVLKL